MRIDWLLPQAGLFKTVKHAISYSKRHTKQRQTRSALDLVSGSRKVRPENKGRRKRYFSRRCCDCKSRKGNQKVNTPGTRHSSSSSNITRHLSLAALLLLKRQAANFAAVEMVESQERRAWRVQAAGFTKEARYHTR